MFKSGLVKKKKLPHIQKIKPAFTIVELLVVIVVIGILAAITIVSYSGITQKATVASLQSDLANASSQLKIYQATYGSYPTAMTGNCPTAPTADNAYCLKSSSGSTLSYSSSDGTTFALTNTNGSASYGINDTSSLIPLTQPTDCPTGFIPVPGSATYSQAGFCVMKYVASHSDATSSTQGTSTTPISASGVQPWTSISQITAIADAPNVTNCNGCHLVTEAEWMTIAQNVLSVASNWSSGVVGSGYIYSGHNDSAPNNALVADSSDSNGYSGETNTGGSQRRTLTLTNGQVIWDLAGNVWKLTAGATNGSAAQEPGVTGAGWGWREWTTVTAKGLLAVNPFPSNIVLSGSSSWTSSNGIGQLYSSADVTGLYSFMRGGTWNSGGSAGVLTLDSSRGPSSTDTAVGFRVSR
jgi:prepilin-type N-terminal cleavage/methylation domain-containing protein